MTDLKTNVIKDEYIAIFDCYDKGVISGFIQAESLNRAIELAKERAEENHVTFTSIKKIEKGGKQNYGGVRV